ncbi:MAG: hypothetical protein HQK54_11230 [Oligoflexales bacterium]|nr:hypothetical protein [Oligoflexales bacterium]
MADNLCAYTANKVWFEFLENGYFRVYFNYTIPELKEFRESYVDFKDQKKAEKFYWTLVRGGEFFPPNPDRVAFPVLPQKPDPW